MPARSVPKSVQLFAQASQNTRLGTIDHVHADPQFGCNLGGPPFRNYHLPARFPRRLIQVRFNDSQCPADELLPVVGLLEAQEWIGIEGLRESAVTVPVRLGSKAAAAFTPLVPRNVPQPAAKTLTRIVTEFRQL